MNMPPVGWETASLRDVTNDISYGFTTSSVLNGSSPKLLRITDIQNGNVDWSAVPHCVDIPRASFLLQVGDIVIARTGATTGKTFLIGKLPCPTAFASYLIRARFAEGVEPKYAWAFMQSADYWSQIQIVSKGTAQPGANAQVLSQLQLPIAPLNEQRRIVTKIDSLSAKSARSRNHLDHIPRLVEKYKKAILTTAFRGELTQEWRKKTGTNTPRFVPLQEVCASISDGDHQAPPRAKTGIPFITISAMNEGVIDLRKVTRFVPRSYFNDLQPARRPSSGDVLYSVTGSFGIPALVDFDEPFVFQRHIAILKPDHEKIDPAFLYRLLAAPQVIEQASAVATGTAQMTIPLSGLREFSFPYPSLDEQREVSRRIETAFAWINRLASEATNARKLIDHLDQAVLAKAFQGELVPQDPKDEPASVLLERIQAEREATPKVRGPVRTAGTRKRRAAPESM